MDLEKINKLLQKYEDGDTSELEENFLRDYFAKKDIPAELISEKKWFDYLNHKKKESDPPAYLKINLENVIAKRVQKQKVFRLVSIVGLAASVLLIIGIFNWNTPQQHQAIAQKDSFEDPAEAYDNVKNTLRKISEIMQKNTEELAHLSAFEKSIKKMELMENHLNESTPLKQKQ